MYTWGQLKQEARLLLWPQSEAINLVAAHDKFFLDGIMDIQKWCECAQQDNTDIVPQCSTLYKCGITVLDAPRGRIKAVSVIDKINPSTLLEDPTQPDDWCSEIFYDQISHCHVDCYWKMSQQRRCCLPIGLFFGFSCHKANYPIPTDAGLPAGLAPLPLGYHYPQTSTDRAYGRANGGRWAMERRKLYIIPWLQSTESVVIKWDGLKRVWADGDPVEQDPLLITALMEYVRWKHQDQFDKDEAEMARAMTAYATALGDLIHECREETRTRECEPSLARFSAQTITNLYYNDTAQTATASCPIGQTGSSVTVTIPSGTVSSTLSVADANAKALTQAQSQAQAQLVCTTPTPTYTNTIAGQYTAICTGDGLHPSPTGSPVTVNIPIGTVTSTISVQDANDQAQAMAQSQAQAQLKCIFWNKQITVTLTCPSNPNITGTGTVAAKTYSSALSEPAADQLATQDATNQANESLQAQGCGGGGGTIFWNTQQMGQGSSTLGTCTAVVQIIMPAHSQSSSISQNDANQQAINAANTFAQLWAIRFALNNECGVHSGTWPNPPT